MILDVYRVTTYINVHRILILIILGSFAACKRLQLFRDSSQGMAAAAAAAAAAADASPKK